MSYILEPIMPTAPTTATIPTMKEPLEINPTAKKPGQVVTSEANAPVETRPTEETVALSPQMAALARKEQKFRQQQQALKEREQALETKAAKIAKLEAMEAKLVAKDYSALEELAPYEDYTQYLLNKQNVDPNQQEVKKLADEIAALKKSSEESQNRQFEAAVNERRSAVKSLVDSNEEYSSIKELNLHEAVVQHILDTFEHDSVELSVEQASKEVEELLVEKANKWAKLSKLTKQAVEEKKQLPPLKQGLKTITNQVTTGDIKRSAKPLHTLGEQDRYAEARRRAEEKLRSNRA